MKIKGIYAAFPISITLFSKHLKSQVQNSIKWILSYVIDVLKIWLIEKKSHVIKPSFECFSSRHKDLICLMALQSFELFLKIRFNKNTLFSMKNVNFDSKVWNIQIEHVKYCIFTVSTRLFRVVFERFTKWWTFFDRKIINFHRKMNFIQKTLILSTPLDSIFVNFSHF